MNLGIAFQLVDDALDYGGKAATLGKNVGDDFREGKITLPVVLSFRRGTDEERAFWKRVLEQGEIEDRISNRPSPSCAATRRSTIRSSAPAITAPWPATPLPCSRKAR